MIILAPNNVVIELDAVLKRKYKADVDVTKHAVERRGKISDNAAKEPIEIEIEGLVTDADIPGSCQTMYQRLNDLRTEFASVIGAYEQYDDMTLTKLEIPEDEKTGESLKVSMTFVHVERVILQQTTVAVKKTSKGPQSTKPTNPPPKTPAARQGLYSKFPGARRYTKVNG